MAVARPTISAVILASALTVLGPTVAAQARGQQVPATGAPTVDTVQNAKEVRDQFIAVMRKYPPGLGRILKIDPGLFSNEAYMAPYPLLRNFVAQHPEVIRNPAYYLEQFDGDYGYYYRRSPGQEMFRDVMTGAFVFVMIMTVLSVFAWIVRTLIDYRRWHRLSKVQAETHTKLLDRFTANDELLAYVQSSAGSRFLQSAPITLDPGQRPFGAPFGRILLTAQTGVVLAAAGLGLYYVSGSVDEEMVQAFYTLGVFGLFVGGGFMAASALSFIMSKKLGLLDQPAPAVPVGRQDS
jgi:hypothetical protein